MLLTVRRSRALLIRCGLGLIAVVSLVAAVPLISDALNATTPLDTESARFASATEAARTITDPDLDSSVAVVPVSSSPDEIAMTERAQDQLASFVRTDEPIDGMPLLTSDQAFPIETITAPIALVGIDDLALIAAIEPTAADWLPLATEVTQLARANTGGSGMSGGGGVFGGGGGGGFGGGAGGGAFVGGGEGSFGVDALGALRGGDSAGAVGASFAADALAARSAGSYGGDSSRDASGSRGQGGDANDRNNGNHRSNGSSNGGPSRGSGNGGNGGPGESTTVPEPSTMMLMAVGAASLAARRLRRRGTSAS